MPATVEQLTQDMLALPDEERAHLAHRLLQSLEPSFEESVEVAWDTEIARRLDRVREGTASGRPAEEVFRDLRARYEA